MNEYTILTDATCDLDEELRNKFKIEDYVKAHILLDSGKDVSAGLTWDWIQPREFYDLIKKRNNIITTSPASVDEFKDTFRKYLEKGIDVIYISLSTGLSGTYNFALKAIEQLKEEFPLRKMCCIDSLRYSLCLGILVCKAYELKNEGKTYDEVKMWIEENKNKVHQMGVMDDLFFLASKGRVSSAKAFMGSLVGIKPLGDINEFGQTTVFAKAKSLNKALRATVEYIKKTIVNPSDQYILIAHTNREKEATKLKELIEKEIKPKFIHITECFPSCGVNIGPGLYAAYYFGTEISKNLENEKVIMENILKTL